jgi:hypothetical protein
LWREKGAMAAALNGTYGTYATYGAKAACARSDYRPFALSPFRS